MLAYLKKEANKTTTENGANTYISTGSDCLDMFAAIGALRQAEEGRILTYFDKAWAEDRDTAMKILFYARDVRGGLGERRIFRIILKHLSVKNPQSVIKNLEHLAEYGRYDDLLVLIETPCEQPFISYIKSQLEKDLQAIEEENGNVSLLAKWLPSVNASSQETKDIAKKIAKMLGMRESHYRHTLSALRAKIDIIENYLREMDYHFDYEKQPSRAMYCYRKAFIRNDMDRYQRFITKASKGEAHINTGTLYPYDIIAPLVTDFRISNITRLELQAMDATWNALPDYTNAKNSLVVIDGSGSMYWNVSPSPAAVALSLGIYFAERNKGRFQNHFITFSEHPRLVEIKGRDIAEKVTYCSKFNEVANTNIQAVFDLILNTAKKHHLGQEEMPERLYIISDMEFDACVVKGNKTNFEEAKKKFRKNGYSLPEIVFWNVASRTHQNPVRMNEQGVSLVSGCSPRLFEMVSSGKASPYEQMRTILESERYQKVKA